jgi:hypothetical protein
MCVLPRVPQAAKSVGQTLRAFQPTIKEVVQVSQEIKGTLEQVRVCRLWGEGCVVEGRVAVWAVRVWGQCGVLVWG